MTAPLLRPTELRDAHRLWCWANDPATRRASHNRPEIPWPEHLDWLTERLSSSDALLLTFDVAGAEPVGSIRFETQDRWRTARLSYVVAPESRNQGLGAELLRQGIAAVRQRHPAVVLVARVEADNLPSRRLFERMASRTEAEPDTAIRFVLEPGRTRCAQ